MSIERRWPWLDDWEKVSSAVHGWAVISVVAAGIVAFVGLYAMGSPVSAWGVAVVAGCTAFGALRTLWLRLAAEQHDDMK